MNIKFPQISKSLLKNSRFFNSNIKTSERWINIFCIKSHDLSLSFCFGSASVLVSALFDNIIAPSLLFVVTCSHLLKYKTMVLGIERDFIANEIKLKKSGIFNLKEQIFKINQIEYLYSLKKNQVYVAIFLKNDVYYTYLIPAKADPKNEEKIVELINELSKRSLK